VSDWAVVAITLGYFLFLFALWLYGEWEARR